MCKKQMIVGAVVVLVLCFSAIYVLSKHKASVAQAPNTAQLTFPVIQPKTTSQYKLDKTSTKYSTEDKVYSYVVSKKGVADLTISLQPTPESFTDVPQVYEKLVEKMRQYTAFDSIQGKVYLTRPVELNGGQTAVMNAKGVLMFVKPNAELSDDEWKSFFNSLIVN